MKQIEQCICIVLIFLVSFISLADEKEDSKTLYETGKEKYEAGKYEDSIADLQQSYDLDNRNFKAKKLLVDALNAYGKQLIEAKEFDKAMEIYTRAYKLWPDNAEIKDMYRGLKDGSIQKKYTEVSNKEMITAIEEAEDTLTDIIDTGTTGTSGSDTGKAEESKEEKELREELERQKKLIEKMKQDYTGTEASKEANEEQMKALQELVAMYKAMADKDKEEDPDYMKFLIEEMKQQRKDFEKQTLSPVMLITIAVGTSVVFIIIIVIIFIAVFSAARRRRAGGQRKGYYTPGLTNPLDQQKEALLLGYDGELVEPEIEEIAETDEDEMYKDLINYERLKKMHTQLKTGNLQWKTVRDNIDILQKDLKTEILQLVELKIEGGDVIDYSSLFPVIFPFLTSGDDYLRKKANVLAYKALMQEKEKNLDAQLRMDDETFQPEKIKEGFDIHNTKLILKYINHMHSQDGRINHSPNVANFARRIGMMIDLPKEDLELLYIAGLVHDFGFLTYDAAFISEIKSEKSLSEEEFEKIKEHPKNGVEYFKNINIELPDKIRDAILYHHERNDGTGYPEGRKDDAIPLFAKIIAVADAFDALTSPRPYHEKLTINSAEIVMRDLGRKKFESKYIDALLEFFKKV